ncbi:MAG: hypothetical protein HYX37_20555 [Rhizobiales bacterium]|nr:hypothetical protein [Hyphomicrobiales bacterium]
MRWINAGATDSVQGSSMVLDRSQLSSPAQPAQPDAVHNLPALAERHDLVSVPAAIPAAWPAGASQLAIAIDVVQRSKDVEVHRDWVAAARN